MAFRAWDTQKMIEQVGARKKRVRAVHITVNRPSGINLRIATIERTYDEQNGSNNEGEARESSTKRPLRLL